MGHYASEMGGYRDPWQEENELKHRKCIVTNIQKRIDKGELADVLADIMQNKYVVLQYNHDPDPNRD